MNEHENILYKVELDNYTEKTIVVKLYTAKKYSAAPSPIKSDIGYVLFLPETKENLELTPSINHLENIVEEVNIKYFPIEDQNTGYTKIFIKIFPESKDLGLLVENPIFTPVSLKRPEPQEIVEKIEKEEIEEKEKVEVTKPVEPPMRPLPRYITREVIVKDYSFGLLVALLLIVFNIALFMFFKKRKLKYKGKLSAELFKKTADFSENDYILLFTENKALIGGIYYKCREKNINLHVATVNIQDLPANFEETETFKVRFSEFNFDEFYKHRNFYRKLNPKPAGVIFDINPKIVKRTLNSNFSFINLKKYIDLNYTNLFLILNLILEDLKNTDAFIIFTGSYKKSADQEAATLFEKIYASTDNTVVDFVEKVKKINPEKISYCLNDFN